MSSLDARQAPAQNLPAQTTPTQQPAARGNQPDTGPVRDANNAVIGFTKLAEIPGTPWRIHDAARPHPRVITPGAGTGCAAVGRHRAVRWQRSLEVGAFEEGNCRRDVAGARTATSRPAPASGSIVTREKFGDVQLHVEFATPSPGRGFSQDRGNSGVIFMGRYEVQVLDSYENVTYADGQAAAIYGEYPPLVNAARKPGEWQTYDIVFEAPKFNGNDARFAGLHHGVLERRAGSASSAGDGADVGDHHAARLHAARSRAAVDAAGSCAPGALPEHLDRTTCRVRLSGSKVTGWLLAVGCWSVLAGRPERARRSPRDRSEPRSGRSEEPGS